MNNQKIPYEREVINLIEASDAFEFSNRLHILKLNLSLLQGNFIDFQDIFAPFISPEAYSKYFDQDDVTFINELISNTSRKLLNYLNMAAAIRDSTRNVINKWYKASSFLQTYNKQVNDFFIDDPFVQFFEGLRNYAHHYRLPIVNAKLNLQLQDENSEIIVGLLLKKSRLLLWDEWKKGKEYLDSLDEDIEVDDIVTEYNKIILSFYEWLDCSIREFHKVEFDWLKDVDSLLEKL